jgi:C1A family cysteine protease
MNKLILLAALLATSAFAEIHVSAPEIKLLWSTWKSINDKVYAQSEEITRFTAFVENYVNVVTLNNENSGAKFALNQFADLTDEEFKAHFGLHQDEPIFNQVESHLDYSILALPESVDWRQKGAVTPVKNQKKCGSCWAFGATGALEGLNFLKTGKLLSFSEQQLVDCEHNSHGCSGGQSRHGFTHAAKKGIQLEDDYPYTAVEETCKYNATLAHHFNSGYKDVTPQNPSALKAAVAAQPVYVSVQADQAPFRFYKSGVVKAGCGAGTNHAVLVVGYTIDNGEEAFIVKNSWDSTWGVNGYLQISTDGKANNGAGVCGILSKPAYPIA